MTLDWGSAFTCAVMWAGLQYLAGEAVIFDRLRGRLPPVLQELAACPMCLGTWLGLGTGLLGFGPWQGFGGAVRAHWPWLDWLLWGRLSGVFDWGAAVVVTGIAGTVLTPVGRSLMALGWAVSRAPVYGKVEADAGVVEEGGDGGEGEERDDG